MPARPVVGIIACNRIGGGEPVVSVVRRYVDAVVRFADCAALVVPSLPGGLGADEAAAHLDGLLLTGSPSNVAPARYGDAAPGDGPFDADRDATAFALIAAFRRRARPVFGICRGFQEINVACGGTLRRDLGAATGLPHHAAAGATLADLFGHRHSVALAPGGILAGLYGGDTLTVNSVHYQGIARLGTGLRVEATAPDGVVEAVSAPNLLAVQWHPEWNTPGDTQAQTLFAAFGAMLRGENPDGSST